MENLLKYSKEVSRSQIYDQGNLCFDVLVNIKTLPAFGLGYCFCRMFSLRSMKASYIPRRPKEDCTYPGKLLQFSHHNVGEEHTPAVLGQREC